jgi:hypothetical protein
MFIRPIYRPFWEGLTHWVGHHLFHFGAGFDPSSFRDTRFLYVEILCIALASILLTIVWLVVDRSDRFERLAFAGMKVFIRYSLSYMVMIYAMDKIFLIQFPFPGLMRLVQSYGDSTPMALMWTFVGYSTVYTIFAGLAEAAGAILILFRRTVTIGALLLTVVMANVALMDLCYDVTVKILAIHFLLLSVFLWADDAHRLLNFFFLNRPVASRNLQPLLPIRSRVASVLLKTLVVLYVLVPVTIRSAHAWRDFGPYAAKPPLYGLYSVSAFNSNGIGYAPLTTDSKHWRYVAIEGKTSFQVRTMDDTLLGYKMDYNPATRTVSLNTLGESSGSGALLVSKASDGGITLTGKLNHDDPKIDLAPIDPRKFTLVSRGFHWISESKTM